MNLEEIINYNLQSDFEVLSDYAFLGKEIYLSHPILGPSLRKYGLKELRLKRMRTDQDGVCEKEGTPQLSILHFKEMAERNKLLKENFEYLTGKIFYEPVEIQEKEIPELLRGCGVKAKDIIYAGRAAVRKFIPVENLLEYVSTAQRKLGYYLETFSGVFGEIKIKGVKQSFAGPLKIFWKQMGLLEKQINGSIAYCDALGNIESIKLTLEDRKRSPIKESFNYVIGCTDYLKGDFAMIDVNISTVPIAFLFGEVEEIPRGTAIPCPEARKDMMKVIDFVLKVERAFVEKIGEVDIKEAERIGKEVMRNYKLCKESHENFLKYRNDYVSRSFNFLGVLSFKSRTGERYPLIAERKTRIKEYLERLKYTTDATTGNWFLEETCKIMEKYSAEFPRAINF